MLGGEVLDLRAAAEPRLDRRIEGRSRGGTLRSRQCAEGSLGRRGRRFS